MKKTLIIARHAHTLDPVAGVADHERELTDEGRRCARESAAWLQEHGAIPDRIIASSAVRTRATASIYAEVLLKDPEKYESEDILYRVTEDELIDLIHTHLTTENTVMLVGHNPTASQLVVRLGASNISYLPPASVVLFTFDIEDWSEMNYHAGTMVARYFPEEPL